MDFIDFKDFIDLRSDTITKPTMDMRQAMYEAAVGDDVFGEDPTMNALEYRIARLFQRKSALFFPSGTMSNLTAVLAWCSRRGSEVIVGDKSHMFLFEQSGMAQFGGVSPRTIPNLEDGTMDLDELRAAIRDTDIHEPTTTLICIENTHNVCGGKILPMEFMKKISSLGKEKKIPIHLDGARIWNALTALKIAPYEIGRCVDSLSVCLSKGLGAPIGSMLIGSREFILKARRIRKALGGGMRQVGILAAAGLKALDDFESCILYADHQRTQQLVTALKDITGFKVHDNVQTNIIFVDIVLYDKSWEPLTISSEICDMLKDKGIRVSAWGPLLMRIVIHRDITDEDIEYIIKVFKEISEYLVSVSAK